VKNAYISSVKKITIFSFLERSLGQNYICISAYVISCHLKDGSFLVLQCSERVDLSPDEWFVIFYHTVVYLFHTSGFF